MKEINVIKRDGRTEPFDVNKVYGFLEYAAHDLKIDKNSIMKKFMANVKDGMTTKQLQDALIMVIVLDIDLDAVDNAILAGRLFLYDLRHRVTKTLGKLHLREYIQYGIDCGVFDDVLLQYDLEELNKVIKHSRDDLFTYVAAYTFEKRYVKKNEEEPFELPQFVFMAVAMTLMQNEFERERYAKEYYEELSQFNVMNSTPTLANARTIRCQLNSCYGGVTHNSAEGIMHSRKNMALLSKFGGGIGWYDGLITSEGGKVNNVPGAAGGIVPLAVTTNSIQLEFDQLGCVAGNSQIAILESVNYNGYDYNFISNTDYVSYIDAIDNYISMIVTELLPKSDKNYNTYMLVIENYVVGKDYNYNEYIDLLSSGRYMPSGFSEVKHKDDDLSDFLINEYGLIIDKHTLKVVKTFSTKKSRALLCKLNGETYYVSTLMAYTFLNYNGGLVYHIDNNLSNVNLSNLTVINDDISDKMKHKDVIDAINDGTIPMYDTKIKPLSFKDIKPGMYVLSMNNGTMKPEFKKLKSKHTVRVEKENQVLVKASNGEYITSVWHPTPVRIDGRVVYKRADEVKKGDITFTESGSDSLIYDVVKLNKETGTDENFIDFTVEDNNNYFVKTEHGYLLTHNTRKGAVASYIEPWSKDIYDFLDLHNPTGDVRRRAYDMNIAVWENQLFMERVHNDETWTLFDPKEVADLPELYGEEFRKRYEHYERSNKVSKKVVQAKDLYTKIVKLAFSSGEPYMVDKDEMNRRHMNKHLGVIYSSNLCTEIAQYAKPGNLVTHIYDKEGRFIGKELGDKISENGREYSKTTPNDTYQGVPIGFIENHIEDDEIFVCTLSSINLSKIHTKEDIARVVPLAIRALDNIIDINYYPVSGAFRHAKKTRAIGLGVMGEHHLLAKKGLEFGSKEALQYMDQIMEWISYYAYEASADLAQEKGAAPGFEGSEWEQGILPIDKANPNIQRLIDREHTMDWDKLRNKTSRGMRNLYVMAIAPTTNIAVVTGTTPSIEPIFKKVWTDKTSVGEFRSIVPDLNLDTFRFYRSAYEMDQKRVIRNLALFQKWVDQAPSGNLFPDTNIYDSTKDLAKLYQYARHLGVVSIYYTRGKSPEEIDDLTQEDFAVCSGCQ